MSYTFLQEQGGESSVECFSDIPAYVLSRLNLTAEKSSCNGNETESCQSSPYGMTLRHSMGDRGKNSLMWYAGDSPVRTYLPPEKGKESEAANDLDCGPNLPGSLAKYNPHSYSWKTAQCSLFGGLTSFSGTWPRWGMMQDGEFWDTTIAAVTIPEKESGLWPTVTKELFSHVQSALAKIKNNGKRKSGVKVGSVFWWEMTEHHLRAGEQIVQGMIPDPCCGEVLMGWPMGWTALQPLETDRFRNAWLLPGLSFVKELRNEK
jgi:hypothetical protein